MLLTLVAIAAAPFGADPMAASVEEVAERRGVLLASAVLGALAWGGAFLVFVAALRTALRSSQDVATGLFAEIGLAGGIVNAALILLCLFFAALAVFRTHAHAELPLLQLLHEASLLANAFTGFASAVCAGAFALALRRVGFPSWSLALGALVALHHVVSAAALAREGVLSPGGAVSRSAPFGMTLWVGAVALLAWQRRERL